MPRSDFYISPPDAPQRQKYYRGRATAKARLTSIIDAGELEQYTVRELAELLSCSIRTVSNYLTSMTRAELAEVDETMLPLWTTRGRMLVMMEREYGNCDDCPALDLCNFLVLRDCLLACEKPLVEEVYGTPEPELDGIDSEYE